MAEALVSHILAQLISITSQQIVENVRLVVGVDKQVEKLTTNFLAIQAVLEDAERRQVKEATVRLWLDNLKDVSFEMEDVLDEWSTAILKSQIDKGNDKDDDINALLLVSKKVSSFMSSSCFSFNPVSQLSRGSLCHGIAKKIKLLNEQLDGLAREKDRYFFNSIRVPEQPKRQHTSSFLDVSEIHGRDEDKETLVRKLLSESGPGEQGKKLHIVSIVGMGGIGKTTLAQLAYNDYEVKSHFEMRVWVCVSDPFEEIRIAKAIFEQVGESGQSLAEQSAQSLVELESILQNMSKNIQERKILFVLDDVWVEDYKKWEPLKYCLQHAAQGSTILVTTRKERVALMMGSSCLFPLQHLSEGHSWSLFSQLAFLGRTSEECETLEKIGRKIVSKCEGLPLAAKTLGSLMRFKRTKAEWQTVLDSEIWELEEAEKGLFPPL